MNNKDIESIIEHLFNRKWDEDLTDEEEEKLENEAETLVGKCSWKSIYAAVSAYMHNNCKTPESAINFACLYWGYGWQDYPLPDPYRFLGYLYYRINLNPEKYDSMDILDSLSTTILPKAGFQEADLVLHTQYMPEQDPKIIEAVNSFKSSK